MIDVTSGSSVWVGQFTWDEITYNMFMCLYGWLDLSEHLGDPSRNERPNSSTAGFSIILYSVT